MPTAKEHCLMRMIMSLLGDLEAIQLTGTPHFLGMKGHFHFQFKILKLLAMKIIWKCPKERQRDDHHGAR